MLRLVDNVTLAAASRRTFWRVVVVVAFQTRGIFTLRRRIPWYDERVAVASSVVMSDLCRRDAIRAALRVARCTDAAAGCAGGRQRRQMRANAAMARRCGVVNVIEAVLRLESINRGCGGRLRTRQPDIGSRHSMRAFCISHARANRDSQRWRVRSG